MPDQTDAFFEKLAKPRHVKLLEGRSGTLLVEVGNGEKAEADRWYVTLHKGDVSVSRTGKDPDAVLRASRDTVNAILTGRMNAMAATLRGLADVEGRGDLLIALQSLFKPSQGAADQREAGYAERPS